MHIKIVVLLCILMFALSGCGSSTSSDIAEETPITDSMEVSVTDLSAIPRETIPEETVLSGGDLQTPDVTDNSETLQYTSNTSEHITSETEKRNEPSTAAQPEEQQTPAPNSRDETAKTADTTTETSAAPQVTDPPKLDETSHIIESPMTEEPTTDASATDEPMKEENPPVSVETKPPVESQPIQPSVTEETAKPSVTEEPKELPFDIDYWVSYAQDYAQSVGLRLENLAIECWDNPIIAGSHVHNLEKEIQSQLNRYAKDEDITEVWIWAESIGKGQFRIFIGYA